MSDLVEIASDALRAAINPLGAELTHLCDADGRELMTDADPAYWSGHAPILFPIVGALRDDRYRVDGMEYVLPKHGFARRSRFALVARDAASATFRLSADDATRACYPFAFELTLWFALDGVSLLVEATVANMGDRVMPASVGFHPAFAWPLPFGQPRDAHHVSFCAAQPRALRALTADGLVASARRASPLTRERHLALDDALFTDDALIWDPVEGDSVRYGAGHGPSLEVAFPDAAALGIWTKPGAAFLCIEPWNGLADPQGFCGEIWDKPGMQRIAPGERRVFRMSVTLVN